MQGKISPIHDTTAKKTGLFFSKAANCKVITLSVDRINNNMKQNPDHCLIAGQHFTQKCHRNFDIVRLTKRKCHDMIKEM